MSMSKRVESAPDWPPFQRLENMGVLCLSRALALLRCFAHSADSSKPAVDIRRRRDYETSQIPRGLDRARGPVQPRVLQSDMSEMNLPAMRRR